jgi:hypothetical protein
MAYLISPQKQPPSISGELIFHLDRRRLTMKLNGRQTGVAKPAGDDLAAAWANRTVNARMIDLQDAIAKAFALSWSRHGLRSSSEGVSRPEMYSGSEAVGPRGDVRSPKAARRGRLTHSAGRHEPEADRQPVAVRRTR